MVEENAIVKVKYNALIGLLDVFIGFFGLWYFSGGLLNSAPLVFLFLLSLWVTVQGFLYLVNNYIVFDPSTNILKTGGLLGLSARRFYVDKFEYASNFGAAVTIVSNGDSIDVCRFLSSGRDWKKFVEYLRNTGVYNESS